MLAAVDPGFNKKKKKLNATDAVAALRLCHPCRQDELAGRPATHFRFASARLRRWWIRTCWVLHDRQRAFGPLLSASSAKHLFIFLLC
jgi:predicted component of type VI protein secretion system